MPKFPDFADRVNHVTGSVFEKFLPKMREKGDDLVKLHIGDSYLPPPYQLPIDPEFRDQFPGFNRYCNTYGISQLRSAVAEKVFSDNHLPVKKDNIMMTCGACNALYTSMLGLVDSREEVIVLTPAWPFFIGMVRMAGGNAIEIPFYTRLYDNPQLDIQDYLKRFITKKTVAMYLNTPNNPSGKVLTREQLQQIADFAKAHQLWVVSDEAYDGMTYDGHKHISIAELPGLFDQTLSIFTFSKVYMFAGLRLGYVAATRKVLQNLNKMMVHQLYSPATPSQYMMIEPVWTRREWSDKFVKHCHELRDIFTENLHVEHHVPEGAYYLFFSIKDYLKGSNYWEVIEALLDEGVSVAPGNDFGKDYVDYIRICFAGESPERLQIAVKRLNQILIG